MPSFFMEIMWGIFLIQACEGAYNCGILRMTLNVSPFLRWVTTRNEPNKGLARIENVELINR